MIGASASENTVNYDHAQRASWDNLNWIETQHDRASGVIVEPRSIVVVRIERETQQSPSSRTKAPTLAHRSRYPYPRWLVMTFAAGAIVAVFGLVLLAAAALTNAYAVNATGRIALAVGTASVALAILRGQNIVGRT